MTAANRKRTCFAAIVSTVLMACLFGPPLPRTVRVGHALPPLENSGFIAHADTAAEYVEGQVIAKFLPGVNVKLIATLLGLRLLDDLQDNIMLLGLPPLMSVVKAIGLLQALPGVIWAEPNFLLKLSQVNGRQRSQAFVDQRSQAFVDGESPGDYFGQYALQLIRAKEAQSVSSGRGIMAAVIDTGVDTNHPLFRYVSSGYDFIDNDGMASDRGAGAAYGHGTMVAGLIVLVAPRVTIMPIRAFGSDGMGKASDIVKSIRHAAAKGANVINMSFSLSAQSQAAQEAIVYAWRRGAVLVASAGNDNSSDPKFPASDNEHVVAVASTDQYDMKADFSNYGSHIDVCAPGVSVYSAYPDGQWAWWSGTSFSAPLVSGEEVLLLSRALNPELAESTAVYVGGGLGSGRIDAGAALGR